MIANKNSMSCIVFAVHSISAEIPRLWPFYLLYTAQNLCTQLPVMRTRHTNANGTERTRFERVQEYICTARTVVIIRLEIRLKRPTIRNKIWSRKNKTSSIENVRLCSIGSRTTRDNEGDDADKNEKILCASTIFRCVLAPIWYSLGQTLSLISSSITKSCRELFAPLFNRLAASLRSLPRTNYGPTPSVKNGMNMSPEISAKIMKSYFRGVRQRIYYMQPSPSATYFICHTAADCPQHKERAITQKEIAK